MRRSVLDRSDGVLDRMKRASDLVEDRLDRATSALSEAQIPYAVIGGLAVALWVRTADDGAGRGTPDIDLMVFPGGLDRATVALAKVFAFREGLRFGEASRVLQRSAVRLWSLDETRFDADAFTRLVMLECLPTVALDDLVRAKITLWRRIDQVHLRDLIGNALIPIGLVDATWLERLPAPLAARLQELLDDPEG